MNRIEKRHRSKQMESSAFSGSIVRHGWGLETDD